MRRVAPEQLQCLHRHQDTQYLIHCRLSGPFCAVQSRLQRQAAIPQQTRLRKQQGAEATHGGRHEHWPLGKNKDPQLGKVGWRQAPGVKYVYDCFQDTNVRDTVIAIDGTGASSVREAAGAGSTFLIGCSIRTGEGEVGRAWGR